MQELIKDKLYSFDEKVRVEIGPQIVELDCTETNLDNKVTHPNYQIGKIDAMGKLITAEKVIEAGTKMNCVDWRAKLVPHMWKVYQMQLDKEQTVRNAITAGIKDPKKMKPSMRFIKINEFKLKDDAIAFAETTLQEMQ